MPRASWPTSTGLVLSAGPTSAGGSSTGPGGCTPTSLSFQRLLGPTLQKVADRQSASALLWRCRAGSRPRPPGWAARSSGAQLGLVLGVDVDAGPRPVRPVGHRRAGPEQDVVYFVGPNVEALERRHGFPPKEFRLWLALHEVTHRFQFTAVPWLRHLLPSLVDQGLEPLGADPRRLLDALRRAADEIRAGRNPLDDAGMLGLVATPEQLEAIRRIQALMSLLEGHGDVTMDRAGADAVPGRGALQRRLAGPARAGPRPGQAPPAAPRPRGEVPPVRGGRGLRPFGRGARAGPACSAASGRGPSGCPPWPRSGTPPSGWRGPAERPPSPGDGRARALGPAQMASPAWPPEVVSLLERCSFPERRDGAHLRRVGRARLVGAPRPRRGRRVPRDARSTSTTGCARARPKRPTSWPPPPPASAPPSCPNG